MRYLPLRSRPTREVLSHSVSLYHFQYLSLSLSSLIVRKFSRCYDIVNVLFENVMKCYNVILWSYNAGVWNNCRVHPVHFRPETHNLNNIGDVNNVINSINHCVFNNLKPFVVLNCNLTYRCHLVNCTQNNYSQKIGAVCMQQHRITLYKLIIRFRDYRDCCIYFKLLQRRHSQIKQHSRDAYPAALEHKQNDSRNPNCVLLWDILAFKKYKFWRQMFTFDKTAVRVSNVAVVNSLSIYACNTKYTTKK